jgi:hypothetical protein
LLAFFARGPKDAAIIFEKHTRAQEDHKNNQNKKGRKKAAQKRCF